jgi:hypothetical protein
MLLLAATPLTIRAQEVRAPLPDPRSVLLSDDDNAHTDAENHPNPLRQPSDMETKPAPQKQGNQSGAKPANSNGTKPTNQNGAKPGNQNAANGTNQSGAKTSNPNGSNASSAAGTRQASAVRPASGTTAGSNPSVAWQPMRPSDDPPAFPMAPNSSAPYRSAPNPSMSGPGLQQPFSAPPVNAVPQMPPSKFSPLPSYSQPSGAPQMNGSQGEILQSLPSHASAFPSSDNTSEGCANCGPNGQGQYGPGGYGPQGSGTDAQTPYMFQPDHYPRALGPGEPLVGTSWQNRPFYVEGFAGTMIGDDAIKNSIGQESGFFTGGRLGLDYDYYWGVESRLGIAWMSLFDKRNPLNDLGNGDIVEWDMALLYYPWGDSKWRPFLLLGTGISQFDTFGGNARGYSATLFEFPFGAGIKFHFNEWLAWRFEVMDNLCFGDGTLDTMNNISFTAGLEYHFGGRRRNYWPWNPDPKH